MVLEVNGKLNEDNVIGVEPMTVNEEQLTPFEQVAVVVETEPSLAGVPLVVVQYESCPAVSFVEVDTLPDPVELIVTDPVDPEMEMLFPATIEVTPELVRTPELLVSPAPTRDVNDCPPMFRLVVDAVVNEA